MPSSRATTTRSTSTRRTRGPRERAGSSSMAGSRPACSTRSSRSSSPVPGASSSRSSGTTRPRWGSGAGHRRGRGHRGPRGQAGDPAALPRLARGRDRGPPRRERRLHADARVGPLVGPVPLRHHRMNKGPGAPSVRGVAHQRPRFGTVRWTKTFGDAGITGSAIRWSPCVAPDGPHTAPLTAVRVGRRRGGARRNRAWCTLRASGRTARELEGPSALSELRRG